MSYQEEKKVRCMLSKMMLSGANILLLDEPTNHLDLESITALNNGLMSFKGAMLFSSHDHQFVETVANRIIEVTPNGIVDKQTTYDEFLSDQDIQKRLEEFLRITQKKTSKCGCLFLIKSPSFHFGRSVRVSRLL
ncbi:hypothetical protein BsIDN1_25840 [Bacillus safensis]|uniref:ABC transporter domain-containing protein n=1 Tax=Bacillus safensis TaxID=561879 RepID=A0A5S9MBN7_BACIA|nr:hypothetical protein BsIDN1_25840 [Bacillus safensis]